MVDKNYVLDQKVNIKKNNLDLVYQIHEYGLDLKTNNIYLYGEKDYALGAGSESTNEPGVEYIMAGKFIKNLNLCMRINHSSPILIHMKTCGGDWESGMAIYDAVKSCPTPVTIINYTHARSMSSIIFLSANKRIMMPSSHFMFHDGTISIDSTIKSAESFVNFNKKTTQVMLNIYYNTMKDNGKFKGKTKQFIYQWLIGMMNKKEEVYLTAEEAVKYGFADSIFDGNWSNLMEYTTKQLER